MPFYIIDKKNDLYELCVNNGGIQLNFLWRLPGVVSCAEDLRMFTRRHSSVFRICLMSHQSNIGIFDLTKFNTNIDLIDRKLRVWCKSSLNLPNNQRELKIRCADLYLFYAHIGHLMEDDIEFVNRILIREVNVPFIIPNEIPIRTGHILNFEISEDLLLVFTSKKMLEVFDIRTMSSLYVLDCGSEIKTCIYINGAFVIGTLDGRLLTKTLTKADKCCEQCKFLFPWTSRFMKFKGIRICRHNFSKVMTADEIEDEELML